MLNPILCNYSDAYIAFKGTITVPNNNSSSCSAATITAAAAPNNRNNEVVFKNFAPFTNCMSEVNNT